MDGPRPSTRKAITTYSLPEAIISKHSTSAYSPSGFTRIELVVVIAVVSFLAVNVLSALLKSGSRPRIDCLSNLRQISLGFSLFANDHDNQFPVQVSTNQGGARELLEPKGVVAQFVVLSNILGAPKILACYADTNRRRAVRFEDVTISNVSYFINADARVANVNQILVGDDHLISDTATSSGFTTLQLNSTLRWRVGRHLERGIFKDTPKGHVAMIDGSARWIGNRELTDNVTQPKGATNRLVQSALPAE